MKHQSQNNDSKYVLSLSFSYSVLYIFFRLWYKPDSQTGYYLSCILGCTKEIFVNTIYIQNVEEPKNQFLSLSFIGAQCATFFMLYILFTTSY